MKQKRTKTEATEIIKRNKLKITQPKWREKKATWKQRPTLMFAFAKGTQNIWTKKQIKWYKCTNNKQANDDINSTTPSKFIYWLKQNAIIRKTLLLRSTTSPSGIRAIDFFLHFRSIRTDRVRTENTGTKRAIPNVSPLDMGIENKVKRSRTYGTLYRPGKKDIFSLDSKIKSKKN